jgi:pimeloyl-ACP methyl ester carboxylesterase
MCLMRWRSTGVGGRRADYGVAGLDGRATASTVVFLHGWALSDRTYRHSLNRLAHRGHTVLAPALPGFRGTAEVPQAEFSLAGYGDWLIDLLDVLDVREPVTLVGHSFGGAVAIKCAHDHPDRVAQLVLVNSIGGATWSSEGRIRAMSERPLGDWGVHLGAELASARGLTRILPVVATDALTHALLRPRTLWRVGRLARQAELSVELENLKQRGTPVAVLWGREDTVIPWACAESLIEALGDPRVVTVKGDHGWLIGDPGRFVEVLTNVLAVVDGLDGPDDGRVA